MSCNKLKHNMSSRRRPAGNNTKQAQTRSRPVRSKHSPANALICCVWSCASFCCTRFCKSIRSNVLWDVEGPSMVFKNACTCLRGMPSLLTRRRNWFSWYCPIPPEAHKECMLSQKILSGSFITRRLRSPPSTKGIADVWKPTPQFIVTRAASFCNQVV